MTLIKCPECGKEVSDKAKSCPNCGCPVEEMQITKNTTNQEQENNVEVNLNTDNNPVADTKNIKKSKRIIWIFVVILLLITVTVVSCSIGMNIFPTDSNSNDDYDYDDYYLSDYPTSSSVLSNLQTYYSGMEFTGAISNTASQFIIEHENLFPCLDDNAELEADSLTDGTISFKQINKNPYNFGDKFIFKDNLQISQIMENDIGTQTWTWMLCTDINNWNDYYSVFFNGSLDIYQDDIISIRALPLCSTSWDNTGGGTTLAVSFLANIIYKNET